MASTIKRQGSDSVYVTVAPDAIRDRAESPAPFVFVDYDADGAIVGFSADGPAVHAAITIFNDWNSSDSPGALDEQLARWRDLVPST